jgi:hypothetical protein
MWNFEQSIENVEFRGGYIEFLENISTYDFGEISLNKAIHVSGDSLFI